MCKYIYTKNGERIIIDANNYDQLQGFIWHLSKNGEPITYKNIDGITYKIKMKHIVMNAFKTKKQIYYLNGNCLDNRFENLSFCKNEIILNDEYAIIKSSPDSKFNYNVKIDLDDVERVKQFSWTSKDLGYMFTLVNSRRLFLHNYILGIDFNKDNLLTDHISGDPTDNRKINLRPSTSQENQYNKRKIHKDNLTSVYKGVSKKKKSKGWNVSINYNGKYKYLGCYSDEIVAANVYNHYALNFHGEFASLNDVPHISIEETHKYKIISRKHTNFKGVTYHKHSKKWIACFRYEGKYIHVGSFDSEVEAAKAYNQKIVELGLSSNKLNIFK